jgi:hypothetical protein
LVGGFGGCCPVEGLAGSVVEGERDRDACQSAMNLEYTSMMRATYTQPLWVLI